MQMFIYNKHKKKKGFTLIELLVAIGIVAILAAVAVPSFLGYMRRARKTELVYDAKVLEDASYRYRLDTGEWPRVGDTPYTAAEVEAFADEIYDCTGEEVVLDPTGEYYDIDLGKLNDYVTVNNDSLNFVLQNPIGRVYLLDGESNTRLASEEGAEVISPEGTGTLAQIKNFGGSNGDNFRSVMQDSAGNYVAVGSSASDLTSEGGNANSGAYDFVIAKLDANLELISINNLGGSGNDYFKSVTEDSAGNYVAVGDSKSDLTQEGGSANNSGGTYSDLTIAKLDANLELVALNNFGGSGHESFQSVIQDSAGDYVAVGFSNSDLTANGGNANSGGYDFVINKVNTNLELVGINNFGGSENDLFHSVTQDNAGNYVAVGSSASDLTLEGGNATSGSSDFVIAKFE